MSDLDVPGLCIQVPGLRISEIQLHDHTCTDVLQPVWDHCENLCLHKYWPDNCKKVWSI